MDNLNVISMEYVGVLSSIKHHWKMEIHITIRTKTCLLKIFLKTFTASFLPTHLSGLYLAMRRMTALEIGSAMEDAFHHQATLVAVRINPDSGDIGCADIGCAVHVSSLCAYTCTEVIFIFKKKFSIIRI